MWHSLGILTWLLPFLALQTYAWRLSEVNEDFSLCASYPRAVIVPRTVDDDALECSARFGQGGRFPVLSYYHTFSRTVSPTPLQILSLAPTASLLGPFLHWGGQFGALAPALPRSAVSRLQQAQPAQLNPAFADSGPAPLRGIGV